MLPPPAPMLVTLTMGKPMRMRAMSTLSTMSGRPLRARLTSKLVPPMSMAMTFLRCNPWACQSAATGPPAGPELRAATGRRRTTAGAATPPLDCMMYSWPEKPFSASAVSTLDR